jgi:hypothetical protein
MDSYKRAESLLKRCRTLGLINPVTQEGSPTVGMLAEEFDAVTNPVMPPSKEVEEAVVAKIRQRRDAGRAKYGTTMEREDLTFLEWINHIQEELLDAAIYAEKIKRDPSLIHKRKR